MITAFFRWFESHLEPYPDQPVVTPPGRFADFVWECTRGARGAIAAMTVFTALVGVFEAVLFAMLGRIVDQLAAAVSDPPSLFRDHGGLLALLAVALFASTALVAMQTSIKHQILSGNLPMRLRWIFHRLMLSQSMGFYQDEFAGRIAAKVMQTALAARDMVMIIADILAFIVVYFVTLVILLGGYDLWLLLPFSVWLVLYVLALCFFVPRLARVSQQQADARSLMTGRVTDAYTNIATVKLFSHAQREAGYARTAMREFMVPVYGQMRLVSGLEIVIHALSMVLVVGTVGTSLWLWSRGEIGMGAVAAGGAMCLRLTGMSHWIMWEMSSLFEHVGTVQDGMGTLASLHTVTDAPGARPLQVSRGDIRFERVSFSYGRKVDGNGEGGALPPVIDQLSLHIRPGEKIGLVGRSGAGKSTIANLLLRFYDVADGRVLIDGQDIAQVTQDSLRAQLGVVTQDTSLLHRSVRENILYGRPDADEAAMIAAATRAEAHEFILSLSDPKGRRGYDAHVGERGVKLSGGQRQRIAIARVMLKDAPILLLDEATSALDSEVEAAIQQSLYRLMEGKTVVAIAHRLSTIAAMDRLIVLDRGRIVEQGSHAELLAQDGLYARLWAHQSGGFLGDRDEDEADVPALE